MAGTNRKDEPQDLIGVTQIISLLDDEPEATDDESLEETAPVPKITRMPSGIEVEERPMGHAVGRWVLQVRCECGRRWFEVESVQTSNCPRCGAMVLVDIEPR